MVILSYVLQTISTLILMTALLSKGANMNLIQILLLLGNVVAGFGYIAAGSTGINAALSCFISGIPSLINYYLQRKNKPIPIWLIIIYAVGFVTMNVLASGFTVPCIFAIAAAMCFVMSVVQSTGKMFRFWCLFNTVAWMTYDIVAETYSGLIIHVTMFVFTVVGMILHDRKIKEKTAE